MKREYQQLVFAIKHYWSLCRRHYSEINPSTQYLNESGKIDKVTFLYRMHLASCCFRIASLLESTHKRQSIYKKLETNRSYRANGGELSVLIRDTVSHTEVPGYDKYELRRNYLIPMTISDIHSVIDKWIKLELIKILS